MPSKEVTVVHYSKFETEILVRPDDIDMNRHVHNSRYLDYVLTARYDQMKRCYGMPFEEFLAQGLTWVVSRCAMEFKRPLSLGERIVVRTWIESIARSDVVVGFEILKNDRTKISAAGTIEYSLVSVASGRPQQIPQAAIEKYRI